MKLRFTYIYILCLLAACSDNKKKNDTSYITSKANRINDFVPENIDTIPQINLSFKKYYKHSFKNYLIYGLVDSANLKQGYWVIQDVKSNLTYKGSYVNNLPEDWWQVITGNTLICAGHYEQNKKQGYWAYLQLGQNKTSKYVNYKNDTLSGLAREFTSDSILISDGYYSKGLKNGYWKFYSVVGIIKEQGNYFDNHKSGWWRSFDDNGKMHQDAFYSKDEISGYVVKYLNEIISEEGKQFNGKNWGLWKYYDTNGKLSKIKEFDD